MTPSSSKTQDSGTVLESQRDPGLTRRPGSEAGAPPFLHTTNLDLLLQHGHWGHTASWHDSGLIGSTEDTVEDQRQAPVCLAPSAENRKCLSTSSDALRAVHRLRLVLITDQCLDERSSDLKVLSESHPLDYRLRGSEPTAERSSNFLFDAKEKKKKLLLSFVY